MEHSHRAGAYYKGTLRQSHQPIEAKEIYALFSRSLRSTRWKRSTTSFVFWGQVFHKYIKKLTRFHLVAIFRLSSPNEERKN